MSKLVNGMIPAHTRRPFWEDCELFSCHHNGIDHECEYSCGAARAFDTLKCNDLYIGNSLSLCIGDILEGKMDVDNVVVIITGVRSTDADAVFEANYHIYWKKHDKERAREMFDKLWPRLICPGVWGLMTYIDGEERWLKANVHRESNRYDM